MTTRKAARSLRRYVGRASRAALLISYTTPWDTTARTASAAEKFHGLPPDDSRTIENFALCGMRRRAGLLESLDAELRGDVDSSPNNLRRRVQLMELRRKMGGVHEALRKARR